MKEVTIKRHDGTKVTFMRKEWFDRINHALWADMKRELPPNRVITLMEVYMIARRRSNEHNHANYDITYTAGGHWEWIDAEARMNIGRYVRKGWLVRVSRGVYRFTGTH